MPVRLRKQLEGQQAEQPAPSQPRVRMRGPQPGIPGVTPGPQGASGFGALGAGVVRGIAGAQQMMESFGFEPTGVAKTTRDMTEQVARQPIAPGLGNQALSAIGETLPA